MKKKLSTVLLLLAAGCSNPHLAINRGVDTTKAPVVQVTSTAYDLRVGPGGRLSGEQVRALDEYLGSIGLAYGDRVGIDDPSAAGGAERREAVAQVVARHGLLLDETVPVTAGTVVPGVLRVVVTRARASVPGCPDWSQSTGYDPDAAVSGNFGCATRGNLAEMIADPNDLVAGKAYTGADGQAAAAAVNAYRARTANGSGSSKNGH